MKVDVCLRGNLSDLRNRLNGSDLVVRMHDRDQRSFRTNRPSYVFGIDEPVLGYGEPCYRDALFLQVLARVHHRMMLNGGGNDVPTFGCDTADRKVIRLGSTTHEDDFRR